MRRLNVELAGIPDEVRVNKCFGRTWKWKVPRSNLELQGVGRILILQGVGVSAGVGGYFGIGRDFC